MSKRAYPIGWNPTLNIWWGQVWRIFVIDIVIYSVAGVIFVLMPVVYRIVNEVYIGDERLYQFYFVLFQLWLTLWTGRESLTDHYSRFKLIAENTVTRRSLFGADKRLKWPIYLSVWWAQLWRMMLAPAAVLSGSFAALVVKHPHAANLSHLLHPVLIEVCLYGLFVLSFWATRESLADRYENFRFSTEPKTFYADGSNR